MVGVGLPNMLEEWGVVFAELPRPVIPATPDGFDGVTVLNVGLDLKPWFKICKNTFKTDYRLVMVYLVYDSL